MPKLLEVIEKLFFKITITLLLNENKIFDHQFGFRQQYYTMQQVHNVVNKINMDFNAKRYARRRSLIYYRSLTRYGTLGSYNNKNIKIISLPTETSWRIITITLDQFWSTTRKRTGTRSTSHLYSCHTVNKIYDYGYFCP